MQSLPASGIGLQKYLDSQSWAHGAVIAALVLAFVLKWQLGPIPGEGSPYLVYLPAVVIAAYFGGRRTGLLVTFRTGGGRARAAGGVRPRCRHCVGPGRQSCRAFAAVRSGLRAPPVRRTCAHLVLAEWQGCPGIAGQCRAVFRPGAIPDPPRYRPIHDRADRQRAQASRDQQGARHPDDPPQLGGSTGRSRTQPHVADRRPLAQARPAGRVARYDLPGDRTVPERAGDGLDRTSSGTHVCTEANRPVEAQCRPDWRNWETPCASGTHGNYARSRTSSVRCCQRSPRWPVTSRRTSKISRLQAGSRTPAPWSKGWRRCAWNSCGL